MIRYEMTDTFGGQPNYCWAKRGAIPESESAPLTQRQILRRVKKELGLTGVRCRKVMDAGDLQRYDIQGACVCFFVGWQD